MNTLIEGHDVFIRMLMAGSSLRFTYSPSCIATHLGLDALMAGICGNEWHWAAFKYDSEHNGAVIIGL